MTVLLRFDRFSLSRGSQRILSDISFDIREGEKIALVGPSGAGKSSLLGEISRRLGDGAALCPQDLGLVHALSAFHNIYMAQLERHNFLVNLWNLFFPLRRSLKEISELAAPFGLEAILFQSVATLSGGERQRVALARACYREKPVFVGDEPVSSLDPEHGAALLQQVFSRHKTVVVALHSPTLALGKFDRVIGLKKGSIAFDQPSDSLSSDFLRDFYRGI